tara:strand:- start:243 stop:608 length:366 start_codon:yes stop_codon:yes gene_type:complete
VARKKFLKRVAKAALAAGAAYAGSKYLASQKPGWGVNEGFTDMDKNVGNKEWISKKETILPKKKPIKKNIWEKAKDVFSKADEVPMVDQKAIETGLEKSNLLWMDDGGEVVLGKNVDKDLL